MRLDGRVVRVGLCGLLLAAMAMPVVAQSGASMTIEGTKQGKFKGESKRKGGEIDVVSVVHEASPQEKGRNKHQHSPVIVQKEVDASSPQLEEAFKTGETLKQVVFLNIGSQGGGACAGKLKTTERIESQGRGSGAGKQKIPEQVELKNVRITGLRKLGKLEEITFAFEEIHVTWIDGGKTDADDWSTPNG